MASSVLSPSPLFSSLHHHQQRHLRTSTSPSSLPAVLFRLSRFPNSDPHRRRTSLLILSSSSSMNNLLPSPLSTRITQLTNPDLFVGTFHGVAQMLDRPTRVRGSRTYWRATASTPRTSFPDLPTSRRRVLPIGCFRYSPWEVLICVLDCADGYKLALKQQLFSQLPATLYTIIERL
ncbi:hypothetical protein BHE74_00035707 [Ensete ventricosum]|uniref:Uncharacterized protein n=1 Tax=Ensete ventricosum TaxID=4639 RepID=A0A444FW66_ENSVE|nr:hypothetical protein B296_00001260 [Ensete ventricosum]RWW26843.1 hypothetical protein GW17_00008754 [Ensete ventricosum]RWW57495.1 hypothetical protein BHE74_00035707 [Ensete ventricosum]RZR78162.1 hypothetical protein BHM03_00003416 [Ensete ventricosum]